MNEIKAIETRYRGYRFRSRLEARWAVFFDALGIEWEYEAEGFQLPSGWYLPDFRLKGSLPMWAEVKADEFSERELRLCTELTAGTKQFVLLLSGMPTLKVYNTACGLPFFDIQNLPNAEACIEAARSARFEHGESPE